MDGKIVRSKTVPLSTQGFGQTLFAGLSKRPSAIAMNDILLDKQITYGELLASSELLARHLLRMGCVKGDVIAIFSPNSIEWIVVMAAAFRIGAVTAAISSLLLSGEVQHQLRLCRSKYLYTISSLTSIAREATTGLEFPVTQIVQGGSQGCVSLESLLQETRDLSSLPTFDELGVEPQDPGLILFSSGTTGLPKAVLLSHRNLQADYAVLSQQDAGIIFDGHILFSPFSHAVGALLSLNACAHGFTTHFLSKFDFIKYLEFIETNRLELLNLMPPVATRLAKSPEVDRFRLDCVKTILCSSAPLSPELEQQLLERFPGIYIRQGFGMTETSGFVMLIPGVSTSDPSSSSSSLRRRKPGSIGGPICNAEVKVVDPITGEDLDPGQTGEMCIRSPLVMSGYLGNPKATAETVDLDGWLHTGDLAFYDEDGDFYIIDRLKELIKYNAYQVAPAELEAVLLTHPEVADAGVFGVPDPRAGELPTAFVVRKTGKTSVTEAELEKYVAERVAPYKRLRGGIKFVSSILKSASGKLLRREMKAAFLRGKL